MSNHNLSTEEIKELLSVQRVLNALLDKINIVEEQITHNRQQIDALSKEINDLSDKIIDLEISTGNELKQLNTFTTSVNQKLFSIEKNQANHLKLLGEIEKLCKTESNIDDQDDVKKKDNSGVNKSIKDVKKLKK